MLPFSLNEQVCEEQENWVHVEENTQSLKSDPKRTGRWHGANALELSLQPRSLIRSVKQRH